MKKPAPRLHGLRVLEDTLREHRDSCGHDLKSKARRVLWRLRRVARRPLVRRFGYGVGGAVAVLLVLFGGLWLRLGAGPIEINFVSPWLASAIEQNIGQSHRVAIGGTQIERDDAGRTAVRIRDMQIRDTDGVVVASAPKAEVAVSGESLLRGELRARRVSLVGAELVGPHRGRRPDHDLDRRRKASAGGHARDRQGRAGRRPESRSRSQRRPSRPEPTGSPA